MVIVISYSLIQLRLLYLHTLKVTNYNPNFLLPFKIFRTKNSWYNFFYKNYYEMLKFSLRIWSYLWESFDLLNLWIKLFGSNGSCSISLSLWLIRLCKSELTQNANIETKRNFWNLIFYWLCIVVLKLGLIVFDLSSG